MCKEAAIQGPLFINSVCRMHACMEYILYSLVVYTALYLEFLTMLRSTLVTARALLPTKSLLMFSKQLVVLNQVLCAIESCHVNTSSLRHAPCLDIILYARAFANSVDNRVRMRKIVDSRPSLTLSP